MSNWMSRSQFLALEISYQMKTVVERVIVLLISPPNTLNQAIATTL